MSYDLFIVDKDVPGFSPITRSILSMTWTG